MSVGIERRICMNCMYYWDEWSGKRCHAQGARRKKDDCPDFEPIRTEAERRSEEVQREYDEYQAEWN